MDEQLILDTFEPLSQEDYINKFEQSQVENESEEDISNVGGLSFSDLAVTGTDWTVETIINQIKKGNIQLDPSFQRRDAWTTKVKSKFIESLFMGLPIPQIILAEQRDKKGKFIVIDGKQRLLSLKQFALPSKNENALKLSGLEVLSKFNRMTYADIENGLFFDDIDAFNNQTIRTVVIKNWRNVEVLYLLFLRLNTGSVKLSPQELRQALYPGEFTDFVNSESGKNQQLQKMLNIKKADFRMRDVEILIRFFAFNFFAKDYSGSMQSFLDLTCDKLNKNFEVNKPLLVNSVNLFNSAINLTFEVFGDKNAFRKFKSGKYEEKYNRAVIDIMLFYFSRIKNKENLIKLRTDISTAFELLCTSDQEFLSSLESTTKSLSSVHYRFRKWGESLSAVTGEQLLIPEGY
ncbi:DUF262 domain-containing protein [Muriventricola aceti]|uniref:DUF262 domain-containing protein n=1 Tax=Muriventricola aceti TaxID=2981773 RepID=UPI00082172E4|nr:DUF262 domain-containing protein [Muriventricola aceti]MCU6701232.1 DUF262 domain-containing protein [Muriventricola aceti]SCI54922.1 Uncharacterized conserved protein [uncultured Flavonifractor sp.]